MKPDVSLNGVSMSGLGWLRETVNFPTPQSQSETVTVPGRNSPIRFSEAPGRVSYQPRSFEITLTMLGTRSKFNELVSETVNRFSGQLVSVVCSEEPGLYAVGTVEAQPAYDPLTGKGQLVLSSADGDAFRYHTEETEVVVNGTGTAALNNDYMPVVPTVTTTEETVLAWTVGSDTVNKTVSAGTWTFPELELAHGENTVSVSGTGVTTFRYREGRL